jgi:F-type H+-transporting ATPase subunit alpha
LLRDVPLDKIREFEELFLERMEDKLPNVLEEFRLGKLDDGSLNAMKAMAADLVKGYKK